MIRNRIEIMCDICGDYDSVPGRIIYSALREFLSFGCGVCGRKHYCKKCIAAGRPLKENT